MADESADQELHDEIEALLQQNPTPTLDDVLQGPMGNSNAANQPMQHQAEDQYVGAQAIPNENANQVIGPALNQSLMGNPNAADQPFQQLNQTHVSNQAQNQLVDADAIQGEAPALNQQLIGNPNVIDQQMPHLNQGHGQLVGALPNPILVGLNKLKQDFPALRHLIEENNPQQLIFDGANLNLFQKLTRALLKSSCQAGDRPGIYDKLKDLCIGNYVSPETVANISIKDVINLGVGGQKEAIGIRNLANSYLHEDAEELNNLEPEIVYQRLTSIDQVGAYGAFYQMVFGLHILNYFPYSALEFRKKLQKFPPGYNQLPSASRVRNAHSEWNPYRGLGAFIVWKYT